MEVEGDPLQIANKVLRNGMKEREVLEDDVSGAVEK